MSLSIRDSQLVTALAEALYDFLPGKPHPRASADLSFPGAANAARLSARWQGGSKQPALTALLSEALARERQRFCPLVVEIVRRSMTYRANKQPLTREEMARVNSILLELGFKIPELNETAFLRGLARQASPSDSATPSSPASARPDKSVLAQLERDLISLAAIAPVPRGTAFERFLNILFDAYGLAARGSFTLRGEQIDGSFVFDTDTYLLEAKWQAESSGNRELAAFNDQVGARATWARGLFVSYAGFSAEGLDAFARGRSPRIVGMDSTDLYHVVRGAVDLRDLIRAKTRRAVEETKAFVPAHVLFPHILLG